MPESKAADIRKAALDGIVWQHFLRIVQRHRIAGLAHHNLSRAGVVLPANEAARLREWALNDARRNIRSASETSRVQELLSAGGVSCRFVKGVSLAELAYGNLGVKHSWDIDVLVSPSDVPRAIQLLEGAGYCGFPPLPPPTDRRHAHWLRYGREYVLRHRTGAAIVELHWKLADNDYFLAGLSARTPGRCVTVAGGKVVRTFDDQQLFAYLCVHGAMHGWARVKWLADVAALIAHDSARELAGRLQAARTFNAEICVAQTFLLCDRLFGTPGLEELAPMLRRSLRNRILERVALTSMARGRGAVEFGERPFDLLQIYLSHFLLGRGWRFVADELWNKLNGPYDLFYAMLPDRLAFLYPFLRLARWIARRGRIRQLPVHEQSQP